MVFMFLSISYYTWKKENLRGVPGGLVLGNLAVIEIYV